MERTTQMVVERARAVAMTGDHQTEERQVAVERLRNALAIHDHAHERYAAIENEAAEKLLGGEGR